MSKLIILILILLSSTFLFSQSRHSYKERPFSKKFKELEKIKLIETLNLDEEIVVKFFARRNKFKNEISNLHDERELEINLLEDMINKNESESAYSPILKKISDNELKLIEIKSKFISSLSTILTKEQIANFIIFERNFKKDVKSLLIERGRKKYLKEKEKN